MDNFQIIRINTTEDQQIIEEHNKDILFLFKKKLLQTTTNSLTYSYFSDISIEKSGNLDILPIDDSLSALAACFYYNIDYILFGEIILDTENNEYFSIIKLYSKFENNIIYEIRYPNSTPGLDEYFLELANKINQELSTALLEELLLEHEKLQQQEEKLVEDDDDKKLTEDDEDTKIAEDDKMVAEDDEDTGTAENDEDKKLAEDDEDTDKNSIIGFFTSIGYYYILSSEWKEYISSTASIEMGIKFDLETSDNEKMDFHLRPGLLFNYSFAFNKDRVGLIIHYHSLLSRFLLEAGFEFSEKFDFFIGSGFSYRFDIIDYQEPTNIFITDIPYAFGTFASLGFDFLSGKRKNVYIGVTNIFDFTFFNELDVNTRLLFHFYFKF